MEETKNRHTPANKAAEGKGDATPERDEQATSSETLKDIEASEKVSSSSSAVGSQNSAHEASLPQPDGDDGGRADGSDTSGPM